MNLESLEKGKELVEIIKTTELGLAQIKELLNCKKVTDNKHYLDGIYSLSISKQSDGSGTNAMLYRYLGNEEVLLAVKEVLEKQLVEYNAMFESL